MKGKNFTVVDNNADKISSQKNWVLMADFVENAILPIHTDKPCWWCREPFNGAPVGLPLRFHKNKEFGQEAEKMKKHFKLFNLTTDHGNEYFETEGIFCSFCCCKAFILDSIPKQQAKYRKSSGLLTLLYLKINSVLEKIVPAPSWKVLRKWGGKLTIEEFRASFCTKIYEITTNTKRPYMYCSGRCVEERDI